MTNDVISFECCKTFAGLVVSFENFPQLLRVVTCPRRLCLVIAGLSFCTSSNWSCKIFNHCGDDHHGGGGDILVVFMVVGGRDGSGGGDEMIRYIGTWDQSEYDVQT